MADTLDKKPSQAVRVIIPPPEVRKPLNTTASFVASKPALESRIRKDKETDPRFSFLNPSDPYHAYYQQRVAEETKKLHDSKPILESNTTNGYSASENKKQANGISTEKPSTDADNDKEIGNDKDNNTTTEATAVVSFLKANRAKKAKARPEPKDAPPDDLYTAIDVKPQPNSFALSVIKLAAEFGARYGPEFLNSLANREVRNPLFDFLKPLHPHFILFQRLRDAYVAILNSGEQRELTINTLKKYAKSTEAILDDVWYMHDWECQKAEREHDATLDRSELRKAQEIDWYDFVVVETVDINDNDENLPPPVADVKQLPMILSAARKAQLEKEKNRGDIDMEIDKETTQPRDTMVETANVDSEIPSHRIRDDIPGNHVSRRSAAGSTKEQTVVLPSGQRVPLSQAEASMRAELLDPSYKDEKARAEERNKRQNLARGEEVARNLARLDQARAEGSVYNRGDLQAELANMPKPSPAEADAKMKKAIPTGPNLPLEQQTDGLSPPAKKARVEAAVSVLSKAPSKSDAKENADEDVSLIDAVAPNTDNIPGLIPEEEWLKKQGDVARVRIKLPESVSKDQEIEMSAPLKKLVENLKAGIAKFTKLPAKKQKLQIEGKGFLKDKMSLAYYNIGDGTTIVLEVKERGGRKKR